VKKLGILTVALTVALAIAWQNRLELLVWALPKVMKLRNPVPPNRPSDWQVGPDDATSSPAERPPNIILILADDISFKAVSLTNGDPAAYGFEFTVYRPQSATRLSSA